MGVDLHAVQVIVLDKAGHGASESNSQIFFYILKTIIFIAFLARA